MLLRGTVGDKLQWLFRFYDTKKKGFLEKDDFQRILNAIYEMMSKVNSKAGYDPIDEKEHLDLVWSVSTFFGLRSINRTGWSFYGRELNLSISLCSWRLYPVDTIHSMDSTGYLLPALDNVHHFPWLINVFLFCFSIPPMNEPNKNFTKTFLLWIWACFMSIAPLPRIFRALPCIFFPIPLTDFVVTLICH